MTAAARPRRTTWAGLLRLTLLSVAALLFVVIPFWAILVNSMKTLRESATLGLGLPTAWVGLDNYSTVLDKGHLLRALGNSLIVTWGSVILTVVLSAMAAWTFARSRRRPMRAMYYVAIVGVALPISLLPTIFLLRTTGLYGGHLGLIILWVGTLCGFGIFLLTGFVKGIPRELEDAARIDGAGTVRTFTSVVLPLLRPAIAAMIAITGVWVWNDFFYSFFFLESGSSYTLPLAVYSVYSSSLHEVSWNLVLASVVVTSLPMLAVFFFAQRSIVQAYMSGSVRG